MPSTSPKQAKLMRAVAHGMKGSGVPVTVAKDFMRADEAKGKYEHSRHKHTAKEWSDSKPLPRKNGGLVFRHHH